MMNGFTRDKSTRLRPATADDWEMLLDWRNDPVTRESSIDTGVVSEDGHRAWLAASIASDDRHLFVVEVDGEPVGTTRLDRRTGGWEISITVAPDQRGKGLGGVMLDVTTEWFDENIGDDVILSTIKPSNPASLALFAKKGYEVVREDADLVHLELKRS